GALAGGSPDEVLTAYLHQAALGMIGAGVRAIPVGHTHGQQVLAYLHDEIRELAAVLCDRDPETAGAGCPFYEVLCDEQTRLYARMLRPCLRPGLARVACATPPAQAPVGRRLAQGSRPPPRSSGPPRPGPVRRSLAPGLHPRRGRAGRLGQDRTGRDALPGT